MSAGHAASARPGVRIAAAFAVSVLAHATLLTVARGWRIDVAPVPRPIVVTMLAGANGDDRPAVARSDAPAAVGPFAPPIAAAALVPAVAPAPIAKAAPSRRAKAPIAERRAEIRGSRAVANAAPAASATADAAGLASATTDAAPLANGDSNAVAAAPAGGGAGAGD